MWLPDSIKWARAPALAVHSGGATCCEKHTITRARAAQVELPGGGAECNRVRWPRARSIPRSRRPPAARSGRLRRHKPPAAGCRPTSPAAPLRQRPAPERRTRRWPGPAGTYPAAADSAETRTTASHISSTRPCGQPADFRPLEDDMPSGRLDSKTPASSDKLTPPSNTVRPRTNDSGMPSNTEPSTIANGAPAACAPDGSLRSPPPRRSSSQSPSVKTAAPARTSNATQPTVRVFNASSMSSKDTEPISSPVPSAITTAITDRLGASRYAISTPTSSAEAPMLPSRTLQSSDRRISDRSSACRQFLRRRIFPHLWSAPDRHRHRRTRSPDLSTAAQLSQLPSLSASGSRIRESR